MGLLSIADWSAGGIIVSPNPATGFEVWEGHELVLGSYLLLVVCSSLSLPWGLHGFICLLFFPPHQFSFSFHLLYKVTHVSSLSAIG